METKKTLDGQAAALEAEATILSAVVVVTVHSCEHVLVTTLIGKGLIEPIDITSPGARGGRLAFIGIAAYPEATVLSAIVMVRFNL